MTRTRVDFSKVRGDSWSQAFSIQYADGSPFDITAAIVRFTIKRRLSDSNFDAIARASTFERGVTITDAAAGELAVTLPSGFDAGRHGRHEWDLEVSLPGATTAASPADGTVAAVLGSPIVTFTSATPVLAAHPGSILELQGALSANQITVPVISTPATNPNLTEFQVEVDTETLVTESAIGFILSDADVTTPNRAMGEFEILPDVSL